MGRLDTAATRRFDRMLGVHPVTEQFVTEAGVRLSELINLLLPLGWYLLVAPGTTFVTLGGVAAVDDHGIDLHRDGSVAAAN